MLEFDHNMRRFSPSTEPLFLNELSDIIVKDYDGNINIKVDKYTTDYVNIKALTNNVQYLMSQVSGGNHANIMNTFESMAEVINELSEENDQLKQRLDTLEMMIGDN